MLPAAIDAGAVAGELAQASLSLAAVGAPTLVLVFTQDALRMEVVVIGALVLALSHHAWSPAPGAAAPVACGYGGLPGSEACVNG